jgi:radical SAM-linked protein
LSMSEGFHPKPRLSFPLALAVGIAGTDEVMELELAEPWSAAEVLAVLSAQAPPGLEFHAAEVLPPGTKTASVARVCYELPLPPEREAPLARRIAEVLSLPACPIRRDDRDLTVDIRPMIDALSIAGGVLHVALRVSAGEIGARPREVLRALEVDDLEAAGFCLTRTSVELNATKHTTENTITGTSNETGNADQCRSAGGVPDRDC